MVALASAGARPSICWRQAASDWRLARCTSSRLAQLASLGCLLCGADGPHHHRFFNFHISASPTRHLEHAPGCRPPPAAF